MANRRTGAQMLSRLYTGGVAVESYPGGKISFRARSTGTFVTEQAGRALAGNPEEFAEVCKAVWRKHEQPIKPLVIPQVSKNVQVTVTGYEPAALVLVRAAAMEDGTKYELPMKGREYLTLYLPKVVQQMRALAEEVMNEIIYTPEKGMQYITASALARRSRFSPGGYTSPDAAMMLKRYQIDMPTIQRRRWLRDKPFTPRRISPMAPEWELGRRSYKYSGPWEQQGEWAIRRLNRSRPNELSGAEKAWFSMESRPRAQEFAANLQQQLQRKSLLGLTLLYQSISGLARSTGYTGALAHARTTLHAPFYRRSGVLREAVKQGIKQKGLQIEIGIDEDEFRRNLKEPYWRYVEEGHEVVIPRPLGRGHPNEYEPFRTGNVVPPRPFLDILHTRIQNEILPSLREHLHGLGMSVQKAAYEYLKVSAIAAADVVR